MVKKRRDGINENKGEKEEDDKVINRGEMKRQMSIEGRGIEN